MMSIVPTRILNLVGCLQTAYDVMEIYFKTNRLSKGMNLVYYSNVENYAKEQRQKTTAKVYTSSPNKIGSVMDNFTSLIGTSYYFNHVTQNCS